MSAYSEICVEIFGLYVASCSLVSKLKNCLSHMVNKAVWCSSLSQWSVCCKLFASTKVQELSQPHCQPRYLVLQLATVLLFDKHRLCLLHCKASVQRATNANAAVI